MIIKRSDIIHSRDRARKFAAEKKKGRHSGVGKRKGTREARAPSKTIWLLRSRVLRRTLRKFRAAKKIDKH